MNDLSRRAFVTSAAALLPAARMVFADPLERRNLGVQLYTVRKIIGHNPVGVLKSIQQIGYAEVEAIYGSLDQIWSALKQTSLRAVSVHAGLDDLNKPAVFANLKRRGFRYVVVPFLRTDRGPEAVKGFANDLNKLGRQANAEGLTLCYHNHAHDFKPMNGTTPLELLLSETRENLLHLEMDIFWVSVAGRDPVALLKKYSGRVPLLHLKDKARGVPVQQSENVPATAFKSVGSGTIDIPAVLAEADRAGVKHYFVEQDQTPGDPIASLRKSYNYLKQHFGA